MEVMQKIVYVACFMGIATVIVEAIEPSEKFRKQIRLIFSLIFVIGITTPILSGKISLGESDVLSVGAISEYQSLNSEVDKQVLDSVQQNIEVSLATKLRENGIECEKIYVSINIDNETGIIINEVNLTCTEIDRAADIVQAQLGAEIKVISNITENINSEGG